MSAIPRGPPSRGVHSRKIQPIHKGPAISFNLNEFGEILTTLFNPKSNDQRKQAEEALERMRKVSATEYLRCLCMFLANSKQDVGIRNLSAVLLRQCLGIDTNLFDSVSVDIQKNVQKTLLRVCFEENASRVVVLQASHALAQCAVHVLCRKDKWPELMATLSKMSESSLPIHRESYLIVLDRLCEFAIEFIRPFMDKIIMNLRKVLKDDDPRVRAASLKTTVSLLLSVDQDKELKYFTDLIPLLFENISPYSGDTLVAKACETMNDLVENIPHFFEKCMGPIINCLGKCTSSASLSWPTRRNTMALLLKIIDANIQNISENLDRVAHQVIPLVWGFLKAFDHETEWNSPRDDSDQENIQFGKLILPQCVDLFGTNLFLSIGMPLITHGLQGNSPDIQREDPSNKKSIFIHKLAALNAIYSIVDSVQVEWETHLNTIVKMTGESIVNPDNHDMVKYVALQVLQKLSVSYAYHGFQEKFNMPVMNTLLGILETYLNESGSINRCVIIQACDTMAHFLYSTDMSLFGKFVERTIKIMYGLINSRDSEIQGNAFKATSVIIAVMEDEFEPFYGRFFKKCIDILEYTHLNKESRLKRDEKVESQLIRDELRGRAMECMSQLFSNVPYRVIQTDCHTTMKNLIQIQGMERESGSSSYLFLMKLFASIASVMSPDENENENEKGQKNEFIQYLPLVIPPLLDGANLKATRISVKKPIDNVSSPNETGKVQIHGNVFATSYHIHGAGETKEIAINTAHAQEKKLCLQMLVQYANIMRGHFFPYVKPVFDLMINQVNSKYFHELRRLSNECMPFLIQSIVDANKSELCIPFLNQLMPLMIEGMECEDEVESISSVLDHLFSILKTLESLPIIQSQGKNIREFIGLEMIDEIASQIDSIIGERLLRRMEATSDDSSSVSSLEQTIESDGGYSEEIEAELADSLSNLISQFTKMYQNDFVKIFDQKCVGQMTELFENKNDSDCLLGLSIFAEIIRYGNRMSHRYIPNIEEICKNVLSPPSSSPSPSLKFSWGLKQQAAYTMGICSEKQGYALRNCKQWVQLFMGMIIHECRYMETNESDEMDESEINLCAENCISSMGKILMNHQGQWNEERPKWNELISKWICFLPLKMDCDERVCANQIVINLFKSGMIQGLFDGDASNKDQILFKLIESILYGIWKNDSSMDDLKNCFQKLVDFLGRDKVASLVKNISNHHLQTVLKSM